MLVRVCDACHVWCVCQQQHRTTTTNNQQHNEQNYTVMSAEELPKGVKLSKEKARERDRKERERKQRGDKDSELNMDLDAPLGEDDIMPVPKAYTDQNTHAQNMLGTCALCVVCMCVSK